MEKNIVLEIKNIMKNEKKNTIEEKLYKIGILTFFQQMSENLIISLSAIFTAILESGLISENEEEVNEIRGRFLLSFSSVMVIEKGFLYLFRNFRNKYRSEKDTINNIDKIQKI